MTKSDRLKIYEQFFHQINLHCITKNQEKIREAVSLIDSWSYARCAGNGELSDHQQKKMVEHIIGRMKNFV